jgi:hypothetical protein
MYAYSFYKENPTIAEKAALFQSEFRFKRGKITESNLKEEAERLGYSYSRVRIPSSLNGDNPVKTFIH